MRAEVERRGVPVDTTRMLGRIKNRRGKENLKYEFEKFIKEVIMRGRHLGKEKIGERYILRRFRCEKEKTVIKFGMKEKETRQ